MKNISLLRKAASVVFCVLFSLQSLNAIVLPASPYLQKAKIYIVATLFSSYHAYHAYFANNQAKSLRETQIEEIERLANFEKEYGMLITQYQSLIKTAINAYIKDELKSNRSMNELSEQEQMNCLEYIQKDSKNTEIIRIGKRLEELKAQMEKFEDFNLSSMLDMQKKIAEHENNLVSYLKKSALLALVSGFVSEYFV